jgi:CRISPR-associated endoribonuclease Cas6
MRFRLSLVIISKNNIIPVNYQYQITAWVYKLLQSSHSPMKRFLFAAGPGQEEHHRKLFTFSNLDFYPYKVYHPEQMIEITGRRATFELSFLMDHIAEKFILDLFDRQRFAIGNGTNQVMFEVRHIASLTTPQFTETMQYACQSPIILSRKTDEIGYPQYLNPIGKGYEQYFKTHLLAKISTLQLQPVRESVLIEELDIPFHFQLLSPVRSRIIKLWENTAWEKKVRGFSFKFELRAPIELHELAYYGGFGEKNALGFGCCRMLDHKIY